MEELQHHDSFFSMDLALEDALRSPELFREYTRSPDEFHATHKEIGVGNRFYHDLNVKTIGIADKGGCPDAEYNFDIATNPAKLSKEVVKHRHPRGTLIYLQDTDCFLHSAGIMKHEGENTFLSAINAGHNHTPTLLRGGIYQVQNTLELHRHSADYRIAVTSDLRVSPIRMLYGHDVYPRRDQERREQTLRHAEKTLEQHALAAYQHLE
jgi:hypothetical protein